LVGRTFRALERDAMSIVLSDRLGIYQSPWIPLKAGCFQLVACFQKPEEILLGKFFHFKVTYVGITR